MAAKVRVCLWHSCWRKVLAVLLCVSLVAPSAAVLAYADEVETSEPSAEEDQNQPEISGPRDEPEFDLFVVVMPQDLLENGDVDDDQTLSGKLNRYAQTAALRLGDTHPMLLPVPANASAYELFRVLQRLRLEGIFRSGRHFRLAGGLFVGQLPMPVIRGSALEAPSLFPFIDLENSAFLYDQRAEVWREKDNRGELQADIFAGVLRAPASATDEKLWIAQRLDDMHEYHTNGGSSSAEGGGQDRLTMVDFYGDARAADDYRSQLYSVAEREMAPVFGFQQFTDAALARAKQIAAGELGASSAEAAEDVNEYLNELREIAGDVEVDTPDYFIPQQLRSVLPTRLSLTEGNTALLLEAADRSGRWRQSDENIETLGQFLTAMDVSSRLAVARVSVALEDAIEDLVQNSWQKPVSFVTSRNSGLSWQNGGSGNNSNSSEYCEWSYSHTPAYFNGVPAGNIQNAKECTLLRGSPSTSAADLSVMVEFSRVRDINVDSSEATNCNPYGGCCLQNYTSPSSCQPQEATQPVYAPLGGRVLGATELPAEAPDFRACRSPHFPSRATEERGGRAENHCTGNTISLPASGSRTISSVVSHRSPTPAEVDQALENPMFGMLPVDAVRRVSFQNTRGALEIVEFPNLFELSSQMGSQTPEEAQNAFWNMVGAAEDDLRMRIFMENLEHFLGYFGVANAVETEDVLAEADQRLEQYFTNIESAQERLETALLGGPAWSSVADVVDIAVTNALLEWYDFENAAALASVEPTIDFASFVQNGTSVFMSSGGGSRRTSPPPPTMIDTDQDGIPDTPDPNALSWSSVTVHTVPLPPAGFLADDARVVAAIGPDFWELFAWRGKSLAERTTRGFGIMSGAAADTDPGLAAYQEGDMMILRAEGTEETAVWGTVESSSDTTLTTTSTSLPSSEDGSGDAEEEEETEDDEPFCYHTPGEVVPVISDRGLEYFHAFSCWMQDTLEYASASSNFLEGGELVSVGSATTERFDEYLLETLGIGDEEEDEALPEGAQLETEVVGAQNQEATSGVTLLSADAVATVNVELVDGSGDDIFAEAELVVENAGGSTSTPKTPNLLGGAGQVRIAGSANGSATIRVGEGASAVVPVEVLENIQVGLESTQRTDGSYAITATLLDSNGTAILGSAHGTVPLSVSPPGSAELSATELNFVDGGVVDFVALPRRSGDFEIVASLPTGESTLGITGAATVPVAIYATNVPTFLEAEEAATITLVAVDSGGFVVPDIDLSDATAVVTSGSASASIIAGEAAGEFLVQATQATGGVSVEFTHPSFPVAAAQFSVVSGFSAQDFRSAPPVSAVVVLAGGPFAGEASGGASLAQAALESPKTHAVLSSTQVAAATDQFSIGSVFPNGEVSAFSASVHTEVTALFPLEISLFETATTRRLASFSPQLPAGGDHFFAQQFDPLALPSGSGLAFESLAEGLVATADATGMNIADENGAEVARVEASGVPRLAAGYGLAYVDSAPALELRQGETAVARVQLFGAEIANQELPALGAVEMREFGNAAGFAITAGAGMPLELPRDDLLFSRALEPGGEALGFSLDSDFALEFADGQTIGQAVLADLSPAEVLLGDPTLALGLPQNMMTQSGFTLGAGREIYRNTEAGIADVLLFDFEGDELPDLLISGTDGHSRLVQNFGALRFRPHGTAIETASKSQEEARGVAAGSAGESVVSMPGGQLRQFENIGEIFTPGTDMADMELLFADFADFDSDGNIDLLGHSKTGELKIFWGDGSLQFSPENFTLITTLGPTIAPEDLGSAVYFSAPSSSGLLPENADRNFGLETPPQRSKAEEMFILSALEEDDEDDEENEDPLVFEGAFFREFGGLSASLYLSDSNGGLALRGDEVLAQLQLENNSEAAAQFSAAIAAVPGIGFLPSGLLVEPSSALENMTIFSSSNNMVLGGLELAAGESATITLPMIVTIELPAQIIIHAPLDFPDLPVDDLPDIEIRVGGTSVFYASGSGVLEDEQEGEEEEAAANIGEGWLRQLLPSARATENRPSYQAQTYTPESQDQQPSGGETTINASPSVGDLPEIMGGNPFIEYDENETSVVSGLVDLANRVAQVMQCDGGCLNIPINYAFFAPGYINVFSEQYAPSGFGVPAGFQTGVPVFGLAFAGFPPIIPCFGTGCNSPNSFFRLYLMPTLTGAVGVGVCTGPGSPTGTGGVCAAFAPSITNLSICDQRPGGWAGNQNISDAITNATVECVAHELDMHTDEQEQEYEQYQEAQNAGLVYQLEVLDTLRISMRDGNSVGMGNFPFTWWDDQMAEFEAIQHMGRFTLALDDFAGFGEVMGRFADRFKKGGGGAAGVWDDAVDSSAEVWDDFSTYMTGIDTSQFGAINNIRFGAWNEVEQDPRYETASTKEIIAMYRRAIARQQSEPVLFEGAGAMTRAWEDMVKDLDDMAFLEIDLVPLTLGLPVLTDQQLLQFMQQHEGWNRQMAAEINGALSSWGCGWEYDFFGDNGWQRTGAAISTDGVSVEACDYLRVSADALVASAAANLQAIESWLVALSILAKLDAMVAEYLEGLLNIANSIFGDIARFVEGAYRTLETTVEAYMTVIAIFRKFTELKNLIVSWKTQCPSCQADRGNILTQLFDASFGFDLGLPVVRLPRMPDIRIEGSFDAALRIPLPTIRVTPMPFPLPLFPVIQLPDAPSLSIEFPTLPLLPGPPNISLPELPLPVLRRLSFPPMPPVPMIPDIPQVILDTLDALQPLFMLWCLFSTAQLPYPEWQLKSVIESLTARPVRPLLSLDLAAGQEWADIIVPSIREILVGFRIQVGGTEQNPTLFEQQMRQDFKNFEQDWNGKISNAFAGASQAFALMFQEMYNAQQSLQEGTDNLQNDLEDQLGDDPLHLEDDQDEQQANASGFGTDAAQEMLDKLLAQAEDIGADNMARLASATVDLDTLRERYGIPRVSFAAQKKATIGRLAGQRQLLADAATELSLRSRQLAQATSPAQALEAFGQPAPAMRALAHLGGERPKDATDGPLPNRALAAIEAPQEGSTTIISAEDAPLPPENMPPPRQTGIFCDCGPGTTSLRIVPEAISNAAIFPPITTDLDADGDGDLLIVMADRIFLKENYLESASPELFTHAPEIANFSLLLPEFAAISPPAISSGDGGLSVSLSPNIDGQLLGVVLEARQRRSGHTWDSDAEEEAHRFAFLSENAPESLWENLESSGALVEAFTATQVFLPLPEGFWHVRVWEIRPDPAAQNANLLASLLSVGDQEQYLLSTGAEVRFGAVSDDFGVPLPPSPPPSATPVEPGTGAGAGNNDGGAGSGDGGSGGGDANGDGSGGDDGGDAGSGDGGSGGGDANGDGSGNDDGGDDDNGDDSGSGAGDSGGSGDGEPLPEFNMGPYAPGADVTNDIDDLAESLLAAGGDGGDGGSDGGDANGDGDGNEPVVITPVSSCTANASNAQQAERPVLAQPGAQTVIISTAQGDAIACAHIIAQVPNIYLDPGPLSRGTVSGHIDPRFADVPVAVFRVRDGQTRHIFTATADELGRYHTEEEGKYAVSDFLFASGVSLGTEEDGTLVRVSDTGVVEFASDQASLVAAADGSVAVMNNGEEIGRFALVASGRSGVALGVFGDDTGDAEVLLEDYDTLDGFSAAPIAGGGAVMLMPDGTELGRIFADGGVNLGASCAWMRVADTNAGQPLELDIMCDGTSRFRLGVSPVKDSIVSDEAFSDAAIGNRGIAAGGDQAGAGGEDFSVDSNDFFTEGLPTFVDVPPGHPYEDAIHLLASRGMVSGYPDGTFRPNALLTRAEFVRLVLAAGVCADCLSGADDPELLAAFGGASFPDVPPNSWYQLCVAMGKQMEIVEGYGDGLFRPDSSISRAEAVAVLLRSAGVPLVEAAPSLNAVDVPEYAWYFRDVLTALSVGLLRSTFGFVYPEEAVTRGEFAAMAAAVLDRSACVAPLPAGAFASGLVGNNAGEGANGDADADVGDDASGSEADGSGGGSGADENEDENQTGTGGAEGDGGADDGSANENGQDGSNADDTGGDGTDDADAEDDSGGGSGADEKEDQDATGTGGVGGDTEQSADGAGNHNESPFGDLSGGVHAAPYSGGSSGGSGNQDGKNQGQQTGDGTDGADGTSQDFSESGGDNGQEEDGDGTVTPFVEAASAFFPQDQIFTAITNDALDILSTSARRTVPENAAVFPSFR